MDVGERCQKKRGKEVGARRSKARKKDMNFSLYCRKVKHVKSGDRPIKGYPEESTKKRKKERG